MGIYVKKDYEITKKIGFKKLDQKGYARESNVVEVTLRLNIKDPSKPSFSCSATVIGRNGRGANRAGQVMDYINENFTDKIANVESFRVMYSLWKKWHLNDIHAGTIEQEAFLDECSKTMSGRMDFDKAKALLEENNLYCVEHNGEMYKYGSGLLYREIDATDLKTIYTMLDIDPTTLKVITAA